MLKLIKSRRGEGYIDVAVLVLCVMLVIALAVSVLPVYVPDLDQETSGSIPMRSLRTCALIVVSLPTLPAISASRHSSAA